MCVLIVQEMQELMDPSRNMSKYRTMLNTNLSQPPVVRLRHFKITLDL